MSIANTRLLAGAEAIDVYFASAFAVDEFEDEHASVWHNVLITLSVYLRQGHTCLSLAEIATRQPPWAADPDTLHFPSLSELDAIARQALSAQKSAQALVYERGLLYSQRYYTFELDVINALRLRNAPVDIDEHALARCHALWPALFDSGQHSEQDWQQVAVAGALSKRFCIINGGPGTGKTYTVTRLMLALQAMSETPLAIQMAAPTGKAAQRLKESVASALTTLNGKVDAALLRQIPDEAKTIHRLLGVSQFGIDTRYNAENPLDVDVLIVDEASMVDLALMARLLRALPEHTRLYLVGDADQLPAVESGNVLDALIHAEPYDPADSDAVHPDVRAVIAKLCPHLPLLSANPSALPWVHTLKVSQRFGGELATVSGAIRKGDSGNAWQLLTHADSPPTSFPDATVSCAPLPASVTALSALARRSMQEIMDAGSPEQALNAINQCRWLTPVKKGPFGVGQLNTLLESVVSSTMSLRVGPHYQGRAIMITRNHYAQKLFNGDVGVVWPDSRGQLKAWFENPDGGVRMLNLSRLPNVDTAFAMTIHKSQGSEFSRVIMVLSANDNEQAAGLYHRGLLYTGLTRAKKQCLILSDKVTFSAMVRRRDSRFSGLRQRVHALSLASENTR